VRVAVADGHRVVGIDGFSDYYSRQAKEHNLALARASAHFTFEVRGKLPSRPGHGLPQDEATMNGGTTGKIQGTAQDL
jgi:hypothetical protein